MIGIDLIFLGVGAYFGILGAQQLRGLLPTITGPEDLACSVKQKVGEVVQGATNAVLTMVQGTTEDVSDDDEPQLNEPTEGQAGDGDAQSVQFSSTRVSGGILGVPFF
ncbi:hypothetical protein OTU49_015379 [Cherax quadricarinatus]|uniref:Uncharacterized protein n=1 Tax=Cherax quadricarinatus TaxID=27406 RepID=A0AAW0YGS6_CHEQU